MEDSSDVLQWWKKHSLTFPTIARMARDILATPISTECKSAISTARNAICQSIDNLCSVPTEALVCTPDWIRSAGPLVIMKSTQDLENENSNLPKTPSSFPACVVPMDNL